MQAEVHKHTIIPAYTHHSQQAQPVTLGHFYMSAYENFARDLVRRAAKVALNIDLKMPQELITNALDPIQNVNRRTIIGGPSPQRVKQMIGAGQQQLDEFRRSWQKERTRLAQVDEQLRALAESIAAEAQ